MAIFMTLTKRFSIWTLLLLFVMAGSLMAQESDDGKKKDLSQKDYINNLSQGNKQEKMNALAYLAKEKVTDAIPQIGKSLKDRDYEVRAEAAATLGKLEDKEKAHPFLAKAAREDAHGLVRYTALLAMVKLGDEEAVKSLKYAHENDPDPDVKDVTTRILTKADELKEKAE